MKLTIHSKEITDRRMSFLLRACRLIALPVLSAAPLRAQISLTSAVDLALRDNPRVHMAMSDVDKATAGLSEAKDVYVPAVVGGSGLGYSYGFPLGQPTLFTIRAGSLVFSYSQHDYIRAARESLRAANLALKDVRQTVAEDTVDTYLGLDHDEARLQALTQQAGFADRLIRITQDRLSAGQDTAIGLTTAQLAAAQIRLARLRTEDSLAIDRGHLARLIGLPGDALTTVPSSVPEIRPSSVPVRALATESPAVASAYANARARQEVAFGDARYTWRPQITFGGEYARFSSFNNYQQYYARRDPVTDAPLPFQYNAAGLAVQISVPMYDVGHKAKARESAADATHALHEADLARDQFLEGRLRLERSTVELAARAEVARLDQQLAQQQLEILAVQLESGTGNPDAPQMTPKDEQNARIAEREKYLSLLDAQFELMQAEVNLLRQTGALEQWLHSSARSVASSRQGPAPSSQSIPRER